MPTSGLTLHFSGLKSLNSLSLCSSFQVSRFRPLPLCSSFQVSTSSSLRSCLQPQFANVNESCHPPTNAVPVLGSQQWRKDRVANNRFNHTGFGFTVQPFGFQYIPVFCYFSGFNHNRTGLMTGSRLNRPVRSGF